MGPEPRSEEHINEFAKSVASYVADPRIKSIVVSDGPNVLLKVSFPADAPPRISALAFDAINCIRSSLDHCVFDAARIVGGKPSPKYTKFPHGKTKTDAENDLIRKKAEVPAVLHPLL